MAQPASPESSCGGPRSIVERLSHRHWGVERTPRLGGDELAGAMHVVARPPTGPTDRGHHVGGDQPSTVAAAAGVVRWVDRVAEPNRDRSERARDPRARRLDAVVPTMPVGTIGTPVAIDR